MSPSVRSPSARWTAATALGEVLAYGLVATAGAALTPLVAAEAPAAEWIVGVGAVVMGLFEGALLGLAQWWALRAATPLSAPRYVGATAGAMTLAWALGLAASYLAPPELPGLLALLVQGAGGGAVLGALLGLGQSAALRAAGLSTGRFWLASSLGWALGLVASAGLAHALPEGPYTAVTVAAAMGSGAVTGAIAGAITAPAVGRMTRDAAAPGGAPRDRPTRS